MRRSPNPAFCFGFVRSWTVTLVVALLPTLAACSDSSSEGDDPEPAPAADGTVAGCRGSYEGSFVENVNGTLTGTLTGTLDAGGTLTLNATTAASGETDTGSDVVQAGVEFAFAVGPYAMRGTFNLATCTVAGTWAEGFNRGDWSLSRVGG